MRVSWESISADAAAIGFGQTSWRRWSNSDCSKAVRRMASMFNAHR